MALAISEATSRGGGDIDLDVPGEADAGSRAAGVAVPHEDAGAAELLVVPKVRPKPASPETTSALPSYELRFSFKRAATPLLMSLTRSFRLSPGRPLQKGRRTRTARPAGPWNPR
jgi:hypothetical protein